MNDAFLLLGSNLGDRLTNLNGAKENILSTIGIISKESSVYESEPWGFHSDDRFLNQMINVETGLSPYELLTEILKIEDKMGRKRIAVKRYISRLIDIDIIFYNNVIISEENLIIPHPRIPERMFTLLPLFEIDPSLIHPVSGKTVAELIKNCKDNLNVYPYVQK